jgi:serine phosphatase RsbU (regulator of sigma subunit)
MNISNPPGFLRFISSPDINTGIAKVLSRAQAAIEKSSQDYEAARTIQDRLLPSQLPRLRGLECFGNCVRCGKLGGDFFDFFSTNADDLTAVIGSVTLTGTAGAILITGLQTCLRTLAGRGAELTDLAAEANRMLWGIAPENAYATLFSARFDRRRGQLDYTSAGHLASVIVRGDGRVARLEPNAAVLGLSRTSTFRPRTIAFEPGDTLIAASEGIAETLNYRELPARMIDEIDSAAGPGAVDRTMIVVRYRTPPAAVRTPALHAMAAA